MGTRVPIDSTPTASPSSPPSEPISEEDREIQTYINFVSGVIHRYKGIGALIDESADKITPQKLNYALGAFYEISLALTSEYQRAKIISKQIQRNFRRWEDEHFIQARRRVIEFYQSNKSIKPAVKEYEIELRNSNREEYDEWQLKLDNAEAKEHFYLRMLDTLNKFDKILVTISNNMRSELSVLSIDKRANSADPRKSSDMKIRGKFPPAPVDEIPVEEVTYEDSSEEPDSEEPAF